MRKLIASPRGLSNTQPRFYSVAETAQILGVSQMTLYRAIRSQRFPAVQLMGRLIIPARVIDEMIDAALGTGAVVDTDDWVPSCAEHATSAQVRPQMLEQATRNH